LLHRLGIADEAITTLLPGVDPIFSSQGPVAEVDGSNDDRPTLLYVGDFSTYKGFPTLLEAVSRLDREVNVVALGEGNPEGFDLDRVERLEVVGFVERGALPPYYRAADLFVMPSVDEAGPNTILEALACGTPVVATDAPGVNEFPPEGTATYFSPREPEPLADALEATLDDLPALKETTEDLTAEGRFHIERTVEGLDAFYRALLDW
jgi:glycosyltransferase involved in cell wall biosynthesis